MSDINPQAEKFQYAIGYTLENLREEIVEALVRAQKYEPLIKEQITEDEAHAYLDWLVYDAEFNTGLLEAAKLAIAVVEQYEGKDECWDALNAAITKAEGES
jgi:uncharacterized membrane protein